MQNLNIFLKVGKVNGWRCCLLARLLACPFGAGGRALCAILLTLAKMDKSPSFCLPSRFVLGASLANMALFRVLRAFLEGFMGFVWVCLVLVLAWLVWLCARVELGGYMT